MKKIIVVASSFLLIAANAIGQVSREVSPSQTTQSNAQQKNKRKEMMNELNLTKEQRGQLKEFRRSTKQKKEAVNNDNTLSEAQKQDKMKELHKEQNEKLNSVLTPEQKEKLREERKKSRMPPDISNETLPPVKSPGK